MPRRMPLLEVVRATETDRRDARDGVGRRREAPQAPDPRHRRTRLRRQPRADADDPRDHGGRRARHAGRRGGRGRDVAPDADGAVGTCCKWSARGRESRPRTDARRVPRPVFALAGTRSPRRRRRAGRRSKTRHARATRSSTRSSKLWRTSSTACSKKAPCRRRQTWTPACCSAPAGRSSSANHQASRPARHVRASVWAYVRGDESGSLARWPTTTGAFGSSSPTSYPAGAEVFPRRLGLRQSEAEQS